MLFINHLKRTQMPLNKIQEYMNFSREKTMKLVKPYLRNIKNKSQYN
ncbi:hypothetical protein AAHB94_18185 [Bacillus toyonensis]